MSELVVELEQAVLGQRLALCDIAFACEAGTHLAVLGPNGAGKTTLLRCIAGLLPFRGDIRVKGMKLHGLEHKRRAREVAYVPQRSLLEAELSVEQVVMMGRFCHQDAFGSVSFADRQAVARALEQMDLTQHSQRSFPRLSGGEQRRVLLARALATEASVVLLDEPTDALDLGHALSLFAHLRQIAKAGKVVISVLHQIADADRFCDQVCLLVDGRSQYQGPAPLPLAMVRQAYGVEVLPNSAPAYALPEPLTTDNVHPRSTERD